MKVYDYVDNPTKYYKETNFNKIPDIFNENNFINYALNFTNINEDIKFESDIIKHLIFNILIGIAVPLNIIKICCQSVTKIYKYKNNIILRTNLRFIFWFDIIILIIVYFDHIIIKRLIKSITIYYGIMERLFKIEVAKENKDDLEKFHWSLIISSINYWFIIFLIIGYSRRKSFELKNPINN